VPRITAKVENVSINEGQSAEFVCKFVANPAPTKVAWFKNEVEELVQNETVTLVANENEAHLTLVSPSSNETGSNFLAKISNQLGEAVSNKATLNVSCGPVFVVEPVDQNVLKDKEAKFECVVKSNPKPNVVWLFNGKEFTNRDGVRMEKDAAKDKYTLVIPKIAQTHVGSITAKASNEFGTVEKTCQLEVLDVPRVTNKLENITVNEGEPAKFIIKFTGKPKPVVKWFKEEIEIKIDETFELTDAADEEQSLTIKSCKSIENSGVYFAKVVNDYGEFSSNKATLAINSEIF